MVNINTRSTWPSVKINDHGPEVDHRFKINDLASRVQINMRAYARAEKFFEFRFQVLINSKRSTQSPIIKIVRTLDHLIDRSSGYKITTIGYQLEWIFEDQQTKINDLQSRSWSQDQRS